MLFLNNCKKNAVHSNTNLTKKKINKSSNNWSTRKQFASTLCSHRLLVSYTCNGTKFITYPLSSRVCYFINKTCMMLWIITVPLRWGINWVHSHHCIWHYIWYMTLNTTEIQSVIIMMVYTSSIQAVPIKCLHLLTASFCNTPNIITHVTSICF